MIINDNPGYNKSYENRGTISLEEYRAQQEALKGKTIPDDWNKISSYVSDLEKKKKAEAEQIEKLYQEKLAKAKDERNDYISLAQQQYIKSTNPYGKASEVASEYGYNPSGGYVLSNQQANYGEMIASQNSANDLYQNQMAEIRQEEMKKQIENDYYFIDMQDDAWTNYQNKKEEYGGATSEGYYQMEEEEDVEVQKENFESAFSFVRSLYEVKPQSATLENDELQEYLFRIYNITNDDYTFIIKAVESLYKKNYIDEKK